MADRIVNVLFLCQRNSARSQMAEAILARDGLGRFKAYSAGSKPAEAINPFAADVLKLQNHPLASLKPKSWDVFMADDAPRMDFVFTVCDIMAALPPRSWPGEPITAHWGIPDPVDVDGPEAYRRAAFADCYRMVNNRVSVFINLPLASLDKLSLEKKLGEIGAAAG